MMPSPLTSQALVVAARRSRALARYTITPPKMPLHLLHHKSYHVYNADNIARVRRDEAAAAAEATTAAEAAAAEAANHRLQLLRARAAGEAEPLPPPPLSPTPLSTNDEGPKGKQKKTEAQRKLDTAINRTGLTDSDGHINLFPEPPPAVVKNAEAEKERLERERKWEANTFHNALGRPCDELRPWYSTVPGSAEKERGERDTKKDEKRKGWADPLKMVQVGVRRLREAEESQREWRRDREREVGAGAGDEAEFPGRGDSWDDTKRRDRHHRDHHRRRSASPRQHDREGSGTRERSGSRRSRSRRRHRHHREKDDDDKRRLEKLRAERERREEHERRKAQELLRKDRERDTPGWKPVEGGRYSKQFGIN
jgi:hypothetical protein